MLKNWKPIQTAMAGGTPAVDICISDYSCEDGDILAVSVNNREVMRTEIFNKPTCERVPVVVGDNNISIFAVNDTGNKGGCPNHRNTGEITIHALDQNGGRANSQSQSWRVPGGVGSSSSMNVRMP